MPLTMVKNRCPQNHRCPALQVCPSGALTQNGFDAPAVDRSKCTDCGKCTRHCPTGALSLAD
jgi:ferredoxin